MKMLHRIALSFLSFISIGTILSFAQSITIKGQVIDENGKPLPGSAVYSSQSNLPFTDSSGYYTLRIPGHESTIHVEALGYKECQFSFSGNRTEYDVKMKPSQTAPMELNSVPKKCVACGSKKVAPILYGLPSKKGMKLIRRGKYLWGGCLEGYANYGCLSCEQLYHVDDSVIAHQ